jgi:hypothetical protein
MHCEQTHEIYSMHYAALNNNRIHAAFKFTCIYQEKQQPGSQIFGVNGIILLSSRLLSAFIWSWRFIDLLEAVCLVCRMKCCSYIPFVPFGDRLWTGVIITIYTT